MKKILKNTILCMLLTLFSCNKDKEVEIIDRSPLFFDDIKQSTYTATGTLYTTNRTISWSGEVFPNEDGIGLYYAITNWTNWVNVENPLCLDYVNGKLVLDDYIKVGEDGDYDLYFGASYFTGRNWEAVSDYSVLYNKTTRTLDFSGTYDGYPVYVGLFGKHYVTGDEIIYDNTQVRDAKLVLTLSLRPKSTGNLLPETRSKTCSLNRNATRSKSVMQEPYKTRNHTLKSVQCLRENRYVRNSN